MATSFSTIRSSNCWSLKSLSRSGVLHSGHAAEGLVKSVSLQPSHLKDINDISIIALMIIEMRTFLIGQWLPLIYLQSPPARWLWRRAKFQIRCLTFCQFYRGSDHTIKKNTISKSTKDAFNPLTPKIWLLILPYSCYTFPCKLVMRTWCWFKIAASTW